MGAFDDLMTDKKTGGAFDDLLTNQSPTPQLPAQKISRMEKIAAGMADPIHGGAQLLTNLLPKGVVDAGNSVNNWIADNTGLVARLPAGGVDQQVRDREAAYQAQRAAAGESGFDWYRVIGNVASPANMALAARGVGAASTIGSRVMSGAATGAASGLMNPVTQGDFASEKAKQAGIGAAFGGAVPVATAALGRIVSPAASRNADVALMRKEGVTPTIGQAMGGRWNSLEEKATSIPVIGDMIANARGRAMEQFNQAAINRATAPIGVKIDKAGREGIDLAQTAVSNAYDDALGQLKSVRLDGQFANDFGQLHSMTRSLTAPMRSKFDSTMNNVLGGRAGTTGTLTAETFKRVDSELGKLGSRYQGSSLASEKELGDALMQAKELLKQQAMRSNPKAADALKAADAAYANLVRVEGAANASATTSGIFTPGQLGGAVKQADRSVRHRMNASGNALMQDLSGAAQNVIGNKVPNSFTTDRAMLGAGALGGASLLSPATLGGLLGGAAMYTRPMQGLLSSAVAARPQAAQAVRNSLLQASPGFVPLGAQMGLGLLNTPSP